MHLHALALVRADTRRYANRPKARNCCGINIRVYIYSGAFRQCGRRGSHERNPPFIWGPRVERGGERPASEIVAVQKKSCEAPRWVEAPTRKEVRLRGSDPFCFPSRSSSFACSLSLSLSHLASSRNETPSGSRRGHVELCMNSFSHCPVKTNSSRGMQFRVIVPPSRREIIEWYVRSLRVV